MTKNSSFAIAAMPASAWKAPIITIITAANITPPVTQPDTRASPERVAICGSSLRVVRARRARFRGAASESCGPCALAAGRRAGRPEDLDPVANADRDDPRHVGGSVERRRQDARRRTLADLVQEALEVERLEPDERSSSVRRVGDEGVRHALRQEPESPRRQRHARLADVDRERALERVEPLVLLRVDMPRRALSGPHRDLDES